MKLTRRLYTILITLSVCIFTLGAQTTMQPNQVLTKAVGVITNTRGVEAVFNITNAGQTGRGSIKNFGGKYKVTLPDAEVWYNGKDLYTYNKRAGETTVVTPTSEELAESNPLSYVVNAGKNYNVSFSTVKKKGKHVLELVPKSKSQAIKRVTLTLNGTNYYPEKIVVEPVKGSPVTTEIISFKTGVSAIAAEFEYPKAKYPKVELVDLR